MAVFAVGGTAPVGDDRLLCLGAVGPKAGVPAPVRRGDRISGYGKLKGKRRGCMFLITLSDHFRVLKRGEKYYRIYNHKKDISFDFVGKLHDGRLVVLRKA